MNNKIEVTEQLVKVYAKKSNKTMKEAKKDMESFASAIHDVLINTGKVMFKSMFTINVTKRAERHGVDITTGEKKTFPASKTLKIKTSKLFKEDIQAT